MRHNQERCRRRLIELDIDGLKDRFAAPDNCIELQIDVQRVLGTVPDFDRAVALSLMKCSAVETAIRLGVGRATVYRAIGRLRIAVAAS